jgi:uncharacterized protein (DUF1684 family)
MDLKRIQITLIALAAVLALAMAAAAQNSAVIAPDAAYRQSFDKWKADETADLKENWLPLAGLFWLKPGANQFGSDSSNQIIFPTGPAHAGEFDLEGKNVRIRMEPAAAAAAVATTAGKPLTDANLDPDISGHPTVVEMGTLRFHAIVRGDRVGIRVKDLNSDALRKFIGMIFFPLDLRFRVTGQWVPSDGKQTIAIPNVLGDVIPVATPGTVIFHIDGKEVRLTATGGEAAKSLSFVFNDLTAKSDTYPGGRFLETEPVSNGVVILDFNRAYNPPCAVTPYATCPLAPKENRLAVAIPAGEKFDRAAHAHP